MKIQQLQRGQVVSVEVEAGHRIKIERGLMWLSFEGEFADILLHAGQSRVAARSGKAVVQALRAGAFDVECSKKPSGLQTRFGRVLKSLPFRNGIIYDLSPERFNAAGAPLQGVTFLNS